MLQEIFLTPEADSPGVMPKTNVSASEAVIDAIAKIEIKRREMQSMEKHAEFAMASSSALHRLNELLAYETEALRLRGPASRHRKNVQAVATEIERVKGLSGGTGRG